MVLITLALPIGGLPGEPLRMPTRLVALDEAPNITLDRQVVVVGRHPSCDARLDSLRVSRHHCCLTQDNGAITVRDLGSTNGMRINGQHVQFGRLRPGDELLIAHLRYRFEDDSDQREPAQLKPPALRPLAGDLLSKTSRILFISRN